MSVVTAATQTAAAARTNSDALARKAVNSANTRRGLGERCLRLSAGSADEQREAAVDDQRLAAHHVGLR
jgi:hypothetical protein